MARARTAAWSLEHLGFNSNLQKFGQRANSHRDGPWFPGDQSSVTRKESRYLSVFIAFSDDADGHTVEKSQKLAKARFRRRRGHKPRKSIGPTPGGKLPFPSVFHRSPIRAWLSSIDSDTMEIYNIFQLTTSWLPSRGPWGVLPTLSQTPTASKWHIWHLLCRSQSLDHTHMKNECQTGYRGNLKARARFQDTNVSAAMARWSRLRLSKTRLAGLSRCLGSCANKTIPSKRPTFVIQRCSLSERPKKKETSVATATFRCWFPTSVVVRHKDVRIS